MELFDELPYEEAEARRLQLYRFMESQFTDNPVTDSQVKPDLTVPTVDTTTYCDPSSKE